MTAREVMIGYPEARLTLVEYEAIVDRIARFGDERYAEGLRANPRGALILAVLAVLEHGVDSMVRERLEQGLTEMRAQDTLALTPPAPSPS